jgi:hypothetical protein
LELQQAANKLGKTPIPTEQAEWEKQRSNVLAQIRKFNLEARKHLGDEAVSDTTGTMIFGGNEFEAQWDIDEDDHLILSAEDPLVQVVALPSGVKDPSRYQNLTAIRKKELELRRGLANDILADIRQTVGQLSFQWTKGISKAPDKKRKLRARTAVAVVHRRLALQAKFYNQVRQAMLRLGMSELELEDSYKLLRPEDIRTSKAVQGPNERGEKQMQLSWIWTTFPGLTQDDNYLTECMCLPL